MANEKIEWEEILQNLKEKINGEQRKHFSNVENYTWRFLNAFKIVRFLFCSLAVFRPRDKLCKIWPTIGKINSLNCFFRFAYSSITYVKRFEKVKYAPGDDGIVVTANDYSHYGRSKADSAQPLKRSKSQKNHHSVWKFQKKSHSTFWVDLSYLRIPKMVYFGEFL